MGGETGTEEEDECLGKATGEVERVQDLSLCALASDSQTLEDLKTGLPEVNGYREKKGAAPHKTRRAGLYHVASIIPGPAVHCSPPPHSLVSSAGEYGSFKFIATFLLEAGTLGWCPPSHRRVPLLLRPAL
jgi:hypothetical protein